MSSPTQTGGPAALRFTDEVLDLQGRRIAVRHWRHAASTGRAPLVFLHDSLGCIATWRDFPQKLAERSGRDALIYERLGHGGSGPFDRPRARDYLLHEARDVLPAVLTACGVERAVLFGHSDGGSIALLAAATLPEQVVGVVAEGAHIFNEDRTRAGVEQAIHDYRTTDIAQRLVKYHGDKVEALYRAWTNTWTAEWFRDWSVEHLMPQIRCPLLVIQGEDDEFGTLQQVYRTVGGASGPARALVLPECGHTPHREARKRVEEEVTAFLNPLP
ncbi:alpha/beta fold hydrolase [Deinococcus sp. VB343]|uniref:alpha/beta fold hydrolase n=1 Tax=Deinococcus sp. VB343 TaxID=3385567 RepID=UPI0039C923B4